MGKLYQSLNGSKINLACLIAILGLIMTVWIYAYGVQTDNRNMIAENSKVAHENRVMLEMIKPWMERIENKLDKAIK